MLAIINDSEFAIFVIRILIIVLFQSSINTPQFQRWL